MINKSKISIIQGWLSIISNLLLFVLKYWAGIATGSIALVADAWHTLSDSVSSIILLIGVKISGQEPDKRHPFGHGRAENIAAIVIAVLLAVISIEFMKDSVNKFIDQETVYYSYFAIVVTIISILTKEFLAQFAFWGSRKTDSHMLRADGWHHRSDALSSVIILIGIFINEYFWWTDAILGILVALFLLYAAYKIFIDSSKPLMGVEISGETIENISEICAEISEIDLDPHHFHLHEYGNHKEVTFHITLSNKEILEDVHDLVTRVENKIREKLDVEATIHVDPLEFEDLS